MRRCATTTSAAGVNPSTSSNASSPGQNDSLSAAQEKCAPAPDACARQRQRQTGPRDARAGAKLELHHLPARDSASRRHQTKLAKAAPSSGSGSFYSKLTRQEKRMAYVDGFVVPMPKKKLQAYRRIATKAGKVWREHGALEVRESVADDVKWGKRTSFPRSVKQKPGETVVFSYIVYKSRADRDRVVAKVMKDKRLAAMMDPSAMPFDGKRMIYGGFKVLVDL